MWSGMRERNLSVHGICSLTSINLKSWRKSGSSRFALVMDHETCHLPSFWGWWRESPLNLNGSLWRTSARLDPCACTMCNLPDLMTWLFVQATRFLAWPHLVQGRGYLQLSILSRFSQNRCTLYQEETHVAEVLWVDNLDSPVVLLERSWITKVSVHILRRLTQWGRWNLPNRFVLDLHHPTLGCLE